ncbi:MAG: TIGR00366 family protein [Planctomycetota bacterium]|nr:TIGR00366 family protein [Planctomycetota bacterium]
MLRSFGQAFASLSRRIVPDPFVLAIFLTFFTFLLCVILTSNGPIDVLVFWGKGFWSLIGFAMQMCLILVTGHAVATSPVVARAITRCAAYPRTSAQAAGLTATVAIVASLGHWGLGLIIGALFARAVGEQAAAAGRKIDYPLVGAAGYSGLLVWHGGFSGTAPIMMTQLGNVTDMLGPALASEVGTLSLAVTIGSAMNLTVSALLVVFVPLLFALMGPREGDRGITASAGPPRPPGIDGERGEPSESPGTFAGRLEDSRILAWAIGAMGLAYLAIYVSRNGLYNLDPDPINMFFLSIGIILHQTPGRYVRAVGQGVRGCAGIILQFPFYFGILGMMRGSGLAEQIATAISHRASVATYPVLTFLSAGLVNLFVPSGGGQWTIQGPIVLQSAMHLQIAPGKAVMAFAYGDQWTNMIQPFWALALLGITGLRAKDIIGYTTAVMVLVTPIFVLPLLFF